jgi:hypothetical protein
MTTRQMMIWVAIVALVIWAGEWASAHDRYRKMAKRHASEEAVWLRSPNEVRMYYGRPDGSVIVQDILEPPGQTVTPTWASSLKVIGRFDATTMAKYHARLKDKYRRAMWNPLMAVPPDPPPL